MKIQGHIGCIVFLAFLVATFVPLANLSVTSPVLFIFLNFDLFLQIWRITDRDGRPIQF